MDTGLTEDNIDDMMEHQLFFGKVFIFEIISSLH